MDYGIELHPWDIAEEGLEQTLAQIAQIGAKRLSLTAAWPGQAVMRPRAPAQRLHFPECGAVYFKPDKARFWVLSDSLAETRAKVCAACGHVQIHADIAKLRKLQPNEA